MNTQNTNGRASPHDDEPVVVGGGRLENYFGGAAQTAQVELFNDECGLAYGTVWDRGHRKTLCLKSEAFKNWLICKRLDEGERFNQRAVRDEIAEYVALASRDVRTLHNRSGWCDERDALYIDLADSAGTVIAVDATKWEIASEPAVYFRRYVHQLSLPLPDADGDLHRLTEFMPPLRSKGDELLLKAWLVTAFMPFPRPILMPIGEQGSGKSTLSRAVRQLVDPSAADLLGHDARADLPLTFSQHAVPTFDNIDSINAKQSDLFCRGTSGGAITRRILYSDGGEYIMRFERPIILNGLHPPTNRAALLDRSLIIELERLTPEQRRTRNALDRAFEAARPKLFGGVLNALRETLALLPTIPEEGLSRMADFHRMGRAAAIALGSTVDEFDAAMKAAIARQNRGAADNTFVAAVVMLARHEKRWIGDITTLLQRLIDTAKAHQLNRSREFWPETGVGLGRKLVQLEPALAESGISVSRPRSARQRLVCLEYDATADRECDSEA